MHYPINLVEQVGHHLKSFRQHRQLTQSELAKRLGLSQSRIADIEAHPEKVSLENILKIFTALQIGMVLEDQAPGVDPNPHVSNSMLEQEKPRSQLDLYGGW